MYKSNLACAIKVDGRVLKEDGDRVMLPFGSEYEIAIRNVKNTCAHVDIDIDGTAIGGTIIIKPRTSVTIERFIRDNNSVGNRFKFIERTSEIEEYSGIGLSDGLVCITYAFEVEHKKSVIPPYTTPYYQYNNPDNSYRYDGTQTRSAQFGMRSANKPGITTDGSVSTQKFTTVTTHAQLGKKHSMVLNLCGMASDAKIEQPIHVKSTIDCGRCGTTSPQFTKFCHHCGSSLIRYG